MLTKKCVLNNTRLLIVNCYLNYFGSITLRRTFVYCLNTLLYIRCLHFHSVYNLLVQLVENFHPHCHVPMILEGTSFCVLEPLVVAVYCDYLHDNHPHDLYMIMRMIIMRMIIFMIIILMII